MSAVNDLNLNIEQLQGPNGIIDDLNILIKKFEEKKLDEYTIIELDEYFARFLKKYNLISSHYETFIAAYIDTNNENEKQTIKLFSDYCLVFLNRIQNKYSNPIQYRINQINNQRSLSKANYSIGVGVFSVFLAVILSFIPYFFPNDNNENAINEIQQMQKSSIIHSRTNDSITYSICLKTDIILLKIDSLELSEKGASVKTKSNPNERKDK